MEQLVVFYDGSCPMCVGVSGWLSRIDGRKQFRLEPYQHSPLVKEHPEINPADFEKQIHVIMPGNRVVKGADAMLEIWKHTGHWSRFLAYIFSVPPFIWLARPVYKLVAKYRKSIYD